MHLMWWMKKFVPEIAGHDRQVQRQLIEQARADTFRDAPAHAHLVPFVILGVSAILIAVLPTWLWLTYRSPTDSVSVVIVPGLFVAAAVLIATLANNYWYAKVLAPVIRNRMADESYRSPKPNPPNGTHLP